MGHVVRCGADIFAESTRILRRLDDLHAQVTAQLHAARQAAKAARKALVGPDAVGLEHGVARIDLKGTVFELVGPDNDRARGHLNSRGEGVLSLELHGLAVKALDRKLSPEGVARLDEASRTYL